MERLMVTIPEAAAACGLSRTKIYELATMGRLTIRKCGKRSLIATDDLRALMESLPPAPIRCRSLTKPAADAA
jgi:excisionase family DNA binding protein